MGNPKHETDIHDLTLGVIHALKMLDAKALSYVQLRRLYAALKYMTTVVEKELEVRAGGDNLGETVRIQSPKK